MIGRMMKAGQGQLARLHSSTSKIKNYNLSAVGSGSRCTTETDTGFTIKSDLPKLQGGHNTAPQPVELLLASLVSCKQATAQFVARHMKPNRLHIAGIEFQVHAKRDQRGALTLPLSAVIPNVVETGGEDSMPSSRLNNISGTVKVYSAENHDPASAEELAELSFQVQHRCPVANMVHASGCNVNLVWSAHSYDEWKAANVDSSSIDKNLNKKVELASPQRRHLSTRTQHRSFSTTVDGVNNVPLLCWRCGEALVNDTNTTSTNTSSSSSGFTMFCTSPLHEGHKVLQPLCEQEIDYFDLFDLPKNISYLLNMKELDEKFKLLQRMNHPDLYASSKHDCIPLSGNLLNTGQIQSEQLISAANSSYINQAYQILRDPVNRASYILKKYWNCNVLAEDGGTYNGDTNLALEIFELREELQDLLDDGDTEGLHTMKVEMLDQQVVYMNKFHNILLSSMSEDKPGCKSEEDIIGELSSAAVRLKYVTKILEEIDVSL
jgi:uncharacterized OsmC-like protein